ncbi:MAG TPA: antitoxin Xre-like helix-turn-helix domain-containing protein [Kofleriaceae bacterium]|nr:antitoxin Xre-like helix-turn-helix domain-containing protein [Kofleriaceae bacterium]
MRPSAKEIRERLGLTTSEWASALGVNERTVRRWESDDDDPSGAADEILRGIEIALGEGADPATIGRKLAIHGAGDLLARQLVALGRPSST